ncbi:MAG: folate family ECF transporter S component [Clostridiales bacterium]|nr:folate family ECF transporter S component [Clostridiales bacterium]
MKTNKLISLALLSAISIILTRFLSFYVLDNTVRLGFGHIPILLAGILFGPLSGALAGAVSDLLGILIMPSYGFFPGFTVASILTGMIPGLLVKIFEKRRLMGFGGVLGIVYITEFFSSILITTLAVSMYYGAPLEIIIIPRSITTLIMSMVYSIIIAVLYKQLVRQEFINRMRK